jgi:hypothetical protein
MRDKYDLSDDESKIAIFWIFEILNILDIFENVQKMKVNVFKIT